MCIRDSTYVGLKSECYHDPIVSEHSTWVFMPDICPVSYTHLLDVLQGVVDDRQVGQAKEVHLDQPQRFARVVFEGGGDGAIGAFQQRRGVGDGCATHDGGAGMYTGLSDQAFDTRCV